MAADIAISIRENLLMIGGRPASVVMIDCGKGFGSDSYQNIHYAMIAWLMAGKDRRLKFITSRGWLMVESGLTLIIVWRFVILAIRGGRREMSETRFL